MLLEEDRDHLVDQSLNLVVTGILAILERELESAILRGRLAPYAFLSSKGTAQDTCLRISKQTERSQSRNV